MANFPTSVYSPSVVSAGQTIDATRDNGQDAEITAIEQGYLTGTAPLNSSNSTHANLSVPGGSTLTTLTVTGGSTLATLSVAGGSTLADLTVVASPPSVYVTSSAALNVNNLAATAITFDIERWMTVAGMHSTASATTKLIPVSSGLYTIAGTATWQGGSTGLNVCSLSIRIDGSSQIGLQQDKDPGGLTQNVAAQYYFRSTTQYVELIALQNSGSTKSISVVADYSPSFMLTKLR